MAADFAQLERDAVVVGNIDRVEIWEAARWNGQSGIADDALSQAVTALGL